MKLLGILTVFVFAGSTYAWPTGEESHPLSCLPFWSQDYPVVTAQIDSVHVDPEGTPCGFTHSGCGPENGSIKLSVEEQLVGKAVPQKLEMRSTRGAKEAGKWPVAWDSVIPREGKTVLLVLQSPNPDSKAICVDEISQEDRGWKLPLLRKAAALEKLPLPVRQSELLGALTDSEDGIRNLAFDLVVARLVPSQPNVLLTLLDQQIGLVTSGDDRSRGLALYRLKEIGQYLDRLPKDQQSQQQRRLMEINLNLLADQSTSIRKSAAQFVYERVYQGSKTLHLDVLAGIELENRTKILSQLTEDTKTFGPESKFARVLTVLSGSE